MEIPKPGTIVDKVATVGLPLAAGFGGFFVGDLGLYEIVRDYTEGLEENLPLSEKLDYSAAITAIPYAIILAVASLILSKVSIGGMIGTAISRGIRWFLVGIIVRLLLAWLLQGRVAPGGMLRIPQLGR